MQDQFYVRARVKFCEVAREIADFCIGAVGDVSTPMRPGERIRSVRRGSRAASLTMLDLTVLVELSEGASWEEVGYGIGADAETARRRYELTWRDWLEDDDCEDLTDTVQILDRWYEQHRGGDPRLPATPVTWILVNAESDADEVEHVEDQP